MKRILTIMLVLCGILVCIPHFAGAQTGGGYFRQEGIASWYGTEFDGRPTASGEIFNSTLFTAAHPSLPFGTLLNVTNTHNNKSVTVKVNDRGPFVSARIIDISMAAAEELDMIITGTAPVIIRSVDKIASASPAAEEAMWSVPAEQPPAPVAQAAPPTAQQPVPAAQPEPAPVRVEMTPAEPRPPEPLTQPAPLPEPVVQQPAPTAQPAPAAVSEAPPPPAPVQAQQPVPAAQPTAPEAAPVPAAPAAQPVRYSRAALTPNITPIPAKKYRLQVGSYKVARNAVESFDKLKAAGLNPAYERFEDYFRVVLPGISGAEVNSIAETLGSAGFREVLIREER